MRYVTRSSLTWSSPTISTELERGNMVENEALYHLDVGEEERIRYEGCRYWHDLLVCIVYTRCGQAQMHITLNETGNLRL